MGNGDNLKLGEGNSAQTPTVVLASVDDTGYAEFSFRGILEAGPTASPDTAGGQYVGVLGRGSDGQPESKRGMAGVAAFGGKPGGAKDNQQGGCGVMGIGGSMNYIDPVSGDQTFPGVVWGPGPGIYGMGGNQQSPDSGDSSAPPPGNGAGVIGDSGISDLHPAAPDLPAYTDTHDVGVYGRSRHGPGVAGMSMEDRGGVFSSGNSLAQLRLVPTAGGSSLPANGQPGDLFVYMAANTSLPDVPPTAQLWFCMGLSTPDPNSPVRWGLVAFSQIQEV